MRERPSEMLADDESRPTPGQVASELLRQRLHQVVEAAGHASPEQLRREVAPAKPKRTANG